MKKDEIKEDVNLQAEETEKKKKLSIAEMVGKKEDNTPLETYTEEGESVSDKVSLIAISELLNLDKLKTISRIKFEQVQILTKLNLFSEVFNIPFTKDIADNILQLQISTNGLGRKELVSLVQQRDMSNELNKQQNISSKNIFK